MHGPDPDKIFPNDNLKRVCFVKNAVTRPNIIVGDYTYYDDDEGADDFENAVEARLEAEKNIYGEFLELYQTISPGESVQQCFQKYLVAGGMPYLANLRYEEAPSRQYLTDLRDRLLHR